MSSESTNDILNRLLVIHTRSLPHFLTEAHPWWSDGNRRAAAVLADIAGDQQDIANRIGSLILERGGQVAAGQFPHHFSTLHDLSFDYLLAELVQYQDRTIAAIERSIPLLPRGSIAQCLAQETLGMAKAHRDMLGELQGEPVP